MKRIGDNPGAKRGDPRPPQKEGPNFAALTLAILAVAASPLMPVFLPHKVAALLWPLGLGTLGALVTVFSGVFATVRNRGRADWLAPSGLPSIYVFASFLLPTYAMFAQGQRFSIFTQESLSESTPTLVATCALSFFLGASFRPRKKVTTQLPGDAPGALARVGTVLFVATLLLNVYLLTSRGVAVRGQQQTTYTGLSFIGPLVNMMGPCSILMLLASKESAKLKGIWAPPPALAAVVLISLIVLNGDRASAVGIVFLLLYGATRNKARTAALILTLAAVTMLAAQVSEYRQGAAGGASQITTADSTLGDLSVVTYTLGATAAHVPSEMNFAYGSSILDGAIRQLPSPLALRLLGPPEGSGTLRFRQIVGYQDPNNGLGFSLPAEGYLNFGLLGAGIICLFLGLLLSFLYGLSQSHAGTTLGKYLYPLALSSFAFALRSDFYGAVKGFLYPAIFLWLALMFSQHRSKAAR